MPFNGHVQAFESADTASWPNCLLCPAASACLTGGLSREDITRWNAVVQSYRPLSSPGKTLFEVGDPMSAIYVVRAGCIKTVTIDDDGNERVRGFHLPGDVIGLDALDAERYPSTAVAVVPSQVCLIPRAIAMRKFAESPVLMQRLLKRTSRDLAWALTLAGDYTADQRVAGFLISMRGRLGAAAGWTQGVILPMTRRDIANFLRLATETVCRVLTRFEGKGWIASSGKNVRLLNDCALRQLAEPIGIESSQPMLRAA